MMSDNDFGVSMGKKLMNFAVGLGIAGAIGVAAAGIGAGTANAAPSPAVAGRLCGMGPRLGPWPLATRPAATATSGVGRRLQLRGLEQLRPTSCALPERAPWLRPGLRLAPE